MILLQKSLELNLKQEFCLFSIFILVQAKVDPPIKKKDRQ